LSTRGSGTVADLGERGAIADIRARVLPSPPWLLAGIGDDAAVAAPERGALDVFTTDALVEGVHFDLTSSTAADVGWKALAVNLSDLAAMGATPRLALLSLVLPATFATHDFHALVDGFLALAREARVTLAGGNIARSPGPLIVDVTAIGSVRPRRVLYRSGARAGDELYVTGTIGAASAGLMYSKESKDSKKLKALQPAEGRDTPIEAAAQPADPLLAACVARQRRPIPRVRVGVLLGRNRAASACMDLSDGLADALVQVTEASGVGATVDARALPIDAGALHWFAAHGADPIQAALAGGEDYELLIAVPRRGRRRLETVRQQARGVALTRIGEVTREPGVRILRDGAVESLPRGFVHF
jgi:thiamine-monophosphate kinase